MLFRSAVARLPRDVSGTSSGSVEAPPRSELVGEAGAPENLGSIRDEGSPREGTFELSWLMVGLAALGIGVPLVWFGTARTQLDVAPAPAKQGYYPRVLTSRAVAHRQEDANRAPWGQRNLEAIAFPGLDDHREVGWPV